MRTHYNRTAGCAMALALTRGGGADKFRIKIWDKDNADAVLYDNVSSVSDDIDAVNPQAIGGGSIVIHKN